MKQCTKCKIKKKNSEFYKPSTSQCKACYKVHNKKYMSTKDGYLTNALSSAKTRSKNKQMAFELDIEYLRSIATNKCPVFNVDLKYASSQKGTGRRDPYSASLDKVIPELGYVKGNVVFISDWANLIKSNATEVQLYAVADWLHAKRKEVLNAFKEQSSPISDEDNWDGELHPQHRIILTPGSWKNSNNPDNNQGTVQGENANRWPQKSDGDSVGHGVPEVGAPTQVESEQNNWELNPTYGWVKR